MTRRRGSALVVVLALVALAGATGVALTSHTRRAVESARLARLRTAARLRAEGGVEAARAALARDPSWAGGDDFSAQVEVAADASDEALRVVRSRAVASPSGPDGPSAVHVVEATLRLGDGLPSVVRWRERR
jgi:hypothetical protein